MVEMVVEEEECFMVFRRNVLRRDEDKGDACMWDYIDIVFGSKSRRGKKERKEMERKGKKKV